MVMQVRRTLSIGATPTGLAEGQISVGMADQPPTAWVGVPTSVNPAGVIPITGLVRTVAGAPQPAGSVGQLWWDEDAAQLFVYTGSEWVVAVNPPIPDLSAYVTSAGPSTLNQATLNQPVVMGVTDGSSAQAGEVGEFVINTATHTGVGLSVTNPVQIVSIGLSAGDWDVWGTANFTGGSFTAIQAALSQTGAFQYNGIIQSFPAYPGGAGISIVPFAFQFSVPTTVILVAGADASSAVTVVGTIMARRVR